MEEAKSELYNELDYDEDYVGCFYAYKSETNHRRYKNCKIDMFMKEVCGDIPYIYLVNYNNDTCRVKLLANEYFRDEKDGDHPYSLTKLERKAFNERMHFTSIYLDNSTSWEIFLEEWNNKWQMGHEGSEVDVYYDSNAFSVPDYSEIKEPNTSGE